MDCDVINALCLKAKVIRKFDNEINTTIYSTVNSWLR